MKKLFLTVFFFFGICLLTIAQSISPTGSLATWCNNCVPQGWSIAANTPSVSQPDWNGNRNSAWVTPLPNPPSSPATKTFVTGYHKGLTHDIMTTNITGLIAGQTYDLEYNVITGKTATTGYAISATLAVNIGSAVIDQVTEFAKGSANLWINKHITFKAESATALVSFNGASTNVNGGIVGLDIKSIKLLCEAGTSQVKIKNNQFSASNVCPKLSVDLNSLVDGAIPANTEVEWFTNDTHTGAPIQDPTNVVVNTGTDFYAFLHDKVNDCYNTSKSLTKIYVVKTACTVNCDAGTEQVTLNTNTLTNTCPKLTVNLNETTVGNPPNNCGYVWYTNPNRTGPKILSPSNAGAGIYYAFIEDTAWGCFNTDNSTAQVTVTINGCQPATPDLTLNLEIDALNFNEGATRDFVVNLFEVEGAEATGTLSFRITKLGAFNITYPTESGNSKVYGSTQNQNGNWTFTETANIITATLKPGLMIDSHDQATIGFTASRKNGIPPKTTQNLTVTIVGQSGG